MGIWAEVAHILPKYVARAGISPW